MNKSYRNSIFLIIFSFLFSASAFSQSHYKPVKTNDLTFGIQGGLNLTNVVNVNQNAFGDNNFSTQVKPGFNIGIFVDIPLIPKLHFQPEVNYSLKGYKAVSDNGTFTRNYNFVDIPLVFKFYPVKNFHIYLGPQISIRASTVDVWTSPDLTVRTKYERRDNELRDVYEGITVGVGIDLSRHILLNAGYAIDVSRSYKTEGYDTPAFRNQVIDIRLGYRF